MEHYLKIKDSDLRVSRIGFGTANAGLAWDGAEAYRMLDAYVQQGGNLIDSARIYSDWAPPETGRSERVLGDWIRHRGHHDDLVILTKCAHPRMDAMHISRLSRAEVEEDLHLSLQALGVAAIDVYCYHRDDESRPVAELVETMERQVRAGKIRYYACSNWSTARMAAADAYCKHMGYRGFVLNEALFNYGTARMNPHPDKTMVTVDAGMQAYHRENDGNVLAAYTGLCGGFFHRLATSGEDAMKDSPYYTAGNLALAKRIQGIAQERGTGITQVLLGYILTRSPGMIALIGASRRSQLDEAMAALAVDFKAEEF